MKRRMFLRGMLASLAISLPLPQLHALERQMEEISPGFGLIQQIVAQDQMRSALIGKFQRIARHVADVGGLTVFEDAGDASALWVISFWKSRADYDASLQVAEFRPWLMEGGELIAKIRSNAETQIPNRSYDD